MANPSADPPGELSYFCNLCNLSMINASESFAEHYALEHPREVDQKCVTAEQRALLHEAQVVHQSYGCGICSLTFDSFQSLGWHYEVDHRESTKMETDNKGAKEIDIEAVSFEEQNNDTTLENSAIDMEGQGDTHREQNEDQMDCEESFIKDIDDKSIADFIAVAENEVKLPSPATLKRVSKKGRYVHCKTCDLRISSSLLSNHNDASCAIYHKAKTFLLQAGGKISCSVCTWVAPSILDMSDHMNANHGTDIVQFTCICGANVERFGIKNKSQFISHVSKHVDSATTKLTCHVCAASKPNLTSFVDHWKGEKMPCWIQVQTGENYESKKNKSGNVGQLKPIGGGMNEKIKRVHCRECNQLINCKYLNQHTDSNCAVYKQAQSFLLKSKATIDCKICKWTAPTILDLSDHTELTHKSKLAQFTCFCGANYCKETKGVKLVFVNHVNKHADSSHILSKKFTCQVCVTTKPCMDSFMKHCGPRKTPCWLKIQSEILEHEESNLDGEMSNNAVGSKTRYVNCQKCNQLIRANLVNIHANLSCDRYKVAQAYLLTAGAYIDCSTCYWNGGTILELNDHMLIQHNTNLYNFTCFCGANFDGKNCKTKGTFVLHVTKHADDTFKKMICQVCTESRLNLESFVDHWKGKRTPCWLQIQNNSLEHNSSKQDLDNFRMLKSSAQSQLEPSNPATRLLPNHVYCSKCSQLVIAKHLTMHKDSSCARYKKAKQFWMQTGANINCSLCNWVALTILDLSDHMVMEHDQNLPKFTCFCGSEFDESISRNKTNLIYHVCKHADKKNSQRLACHICAISKTSLEDFVGHWKGMNTPCWLKIQNNENNETVGQDDNSVIETMHTEQADDMDASKIVLPKHVHCQNCEQLIIAKHLSKHNDAGCARYRKVKAYLTSSEAKLNCNICDLLAPTILDLNDHMIMEHNQHLAKLTCFCGSDFKESKRNLIEHLSKHVDKMDSQRLVCHVCTIGKTNLEEFVGHWKGMKTPCWLTVQNRNSEEQSFETTKPTITEELKQKPKARNNKQIQCLKCTRFITAKCFYTHSDISCARYKKIKSYLHSTGAKIACTVCKWEAPTIFDLADHLSQQHGSLLKTFICFCGAEFSGTQPRDKLMKHLFNVHMVGMVGKKVTCMVCMISKPNVESFVKHRKKTPCWVKEQNKFIK